MIHFFVIVKNPEDSTQNSLLQVMPYSGKDENDFRSDWETAQKKHPEMFDERLAMLRKMGWRIHEMGCPLQVEAAA